MTMCLAVKAQLAGEPRLVFCCDSLAGNDYSSYEDVSKYEVLGAGLMGLFAGPVTAGDELFRLYKKKLTGIAITEDNIFDLIQKPMDDFNQRVSRRKSDSGTPPQYVDLIIFGFVESLPRIFHISQKDAILEEADLKCAIGSGALAAWTMLEWRGLSRSSLLDHVLYAAFEAKKLAEAGPPVGKKVTMLAFLEPLGLSDFRREAVFGEGLALLDEAFQRFGPKHIDNSWGLPTRVTHPTGSGSPE
jgi:hypothetical protein